VIPGQTDADPQDQPATRAPAGADAVDATRPPLRLHWALLIALAGGLLLAAAFPPYGRWPLAFIGPALLVVALSGRSLRASFAVGLVFGLDFFFPLVAWVINLAWFAWAAGPSCATYAAPICSISGSRLSPTVCKEPGRL